MYALKAKRPNRLTTDSSPVQRINWKTSNMSESSGQCWRLRAQSGNKGGQCRGVKGKTMRCFSKQAEFRGFVCCRCHETSPKNEPQEHVGHSKVHPEQELGQMGAEPPVYIRPCRLSKIGTESLGEGRGGATGGIGQMRPGLWQWRR